MTINLQTYSKYINSGVEWLGEIPSEWDILPFKKIFKLSNERVENTPSLDLALSVSGYRGVEPRNIDSMEGQMPSEDIGKYRIVRRGQLAVNTMWLNYAGLGVSDYEGYISPAYRSYNIDRAVNKKFVHYLLRSPLYIQKYTSMLYGLRPNSLQVKNDDFERLEILMPPHETQNSIADYLDEKTKIIGEMVAKKEKLIELLREKRAALITSAVTKGLDPKAKMKPSGIDWLGDIPEGWEIRKLKFGADIIMGQSPDSDDYEDIESGIPFLQGNAEFTEHGPIPNLWCQTANKISRMGDILLSVRAPVGAINISDQKYGIGRGLCAIKGLLFYQKYLAYLLSACNEYLNILATGSTFTAISVDDVKALSLPLPSVEIQQTIAEFLDIKTAKIDEVINNMKKQTEQLKEYRLSLIYSAVTGKIKV